MAWSFKSGASLHQLIQDSPCDILLEYLTGADPDVAVLAPEATEAASESDLREWLLSRFDEVDTEAARRLNDVAARVVKLGAGRGIQALERIVPATRLSAASMTEFDKQRNPLGRSLWTFLHERAAFENAESYLYASHFRSGGKTFAAFETLEPGPSTFAWTEPLVAKLTDRIVSDLEVKPPCNLTHLVVDEGAEAERTHVVIVRHAGALTSVAEHDEVGHRRHHYYRPPNEALLIYSPGRQQVEVCADGLAMRQDLATCFAEVALKQDLSRRPLAFRLYNLSRFRESFTLPFHQPHGYRVESASVVEIAVRPGNPRHWLSLSVMAEDDIEMVLRRLFGSRGIFGSGGTLARVVIAICFWPAGQSKAKTLNVMLSYPNRCNLGSEANPEYRRLGYSLLEHWGIMQPLTPLADLDERTLLPLLLDLYDRKADEVTEQELLDRRSDVGLLVTGGFIEARGRHSDLLLDDDDHGLDQVEARPGAYGRAEVDDAVGKPAWLPGALVQKYAVKRDWIEEAVRKLLRPLLGTTTLQRPIDGLTLMGTAALGDERVPCYLACGSGDPRAANAQENYLRGLDTGDIGLVLHAGREVPAFLGANVVLSLPDIISSDPDAELIPVDTLNLLYRQGRSRARGATGVEFIIGKGGATLHVAGRKPLSVSGENQIKILQRLVEAFLSANPLVRTAVLIADTGVTSPTQAFRKKDNVVGVYFDKGPTRGTWRLLA